MDIVIQIAGYCTFGVIGLLRHAPSLEYDINYRRYIFFEFIYLCEKIHTLALSVGYLYSVFMIPGAVNRFRFAPPG